ncbi:hypothetical protein MAR_018712 [Mya arenaria]|uniref:B box-type domain-containing protein n=1 Tax=Mya arenaria TaxID=6604 RepID=A0ABY7EI88_MYAAR|nr:hypothetical protein MAR_018712 [Mya arenaria]
MSDMFTFSDADRYNNILQMLIRCCATVMKRLLPMFVSSLGYTCVDQFLSREKAHILKMPSASLQTNQAILYPPSGAQTQIEEWDMSLLSCVFTQVQRKLLCNEIADPMDPVLMQYKLEVLATTVGQQYEDKLYPRSGKPTEVNTWNMSLCSCLFSVLCPKPQTLYVRLAESFNVLREMRNTLCHSERLEMENEVYEEHMLVLKEFISSGLTYIGDVAFETEIKEDLDDIEHGKMRSYVAIDHKHLQESYKSERVIYQRLDSLEKAVQQLTYQLENDQGAKRECLKIQLNFNNAVWMWKFIKCYISGTLDSSLEPIQTLLRTKKEFENLEMTVVLPDVFAALNISGKPKEIDSSITMCVLELLNQRLIPLEENQQDDSVCKSLPLKLANIQHDVENADIRTRKMEFGESGETLPESGQNISKAVSLQLREQFFEEYSIDEAGKKVKILIQQETPTEEYTVDESGEKVKAILDKDEKHIETFTIDESGQHIKAVKPRESMEMYSTSASESKKKHVSYYCEPCLEDKGKLPPVVKCKDCDELLCSDCARVHRKSKMSRDHIMIGDVVLSFASNCRVCFIYQTTTGLVLNEHHTLLLINYQAMYLSAAKFEQSFCRTILSCLKMLNELCFEDPGDA